jgi:hypothetical protein
VRWTRINYQRLKVVRKFENERAEVTVELDPGDDPAVVYRQAKLFVEQQLGIKYCSDHGQSQPCDVCREDARKFLHATAPIEPHWPDDEPGGYGSLG